MAQCKSSLDKVLALVENNIKCNRSDQIIAFVGKTKAGKSTLINCLLGNKVQIVREEEKKSEDGENSEDEDDDEDIVLVKADDKIGPKIGKFGKSETYIPAGYGVLPNTDWPLWDFPGFGDNKGVEQEIANAINIHNILKQAKSVRVVLVVPWPEVKHHNPLPFFIQLDELNKLNSNIKQNLCLVISKGERGDLRKVLQKLAFSETSVDVSVEYAKIYSAAKDILKGVLAKDSYFYFKAPPRKTKPNPLKITYGEVSMLEKIVFTIFDFIINLVNNICWLLKTLLILLAAFFLFPYYSYYSEHFIDFTNIPPETMKDSEIVKRLMYDMYPGDDSDSELFYEIDLSSFTVALKNISSLDLKSSNMHISDGAQLNLKNYHELIYKFFEGVISNRQNKLDEIKYIKYQEVRDLEPDTKFKALSEFKYRLKSICFSDPIHLIEAVDSMLKNRHCTEVIEMIKTVQYIEHFLENLNKNGKYLKCLDVFTKELKLMLDAASESMNDHIAEVSKEAVKEPERRRLKKEGERERQEKEMLQAEIEKLKKENEKHIFHKIWDSATSWPWF